jgi:type IV pilus assembly protein PilA
MKMRFIPVILRRAFTLQNFSKKNLSGFTLVELLIVIAILAVLAAAVVIVLNPAEFLSQGRDAKRVSDLRNIVSSLNIYISDYPQASIGDFQTVYISIPDTSSTCTSHALPSLPSGWSYRCATGENHMKTDGTGWVPVDFDSVKGGSPLPYIPIDQDNTAVSGRYYIYVPDGWAFASALGSSKYLKEIAPKDGGFDPIRFETGKNLSVIGIINRLAGIWDFDDGSGGTVSEAGISGNNGTIFGDPQWTEGVSGSALLFDGEGDYVRVLI